MNGKYENKIQSSENRQNNGTENKKFENKKSGAEDKKNSPQDRSPTQGR